MHSSEPRDVLAVEGPFACAYFDASHGADVLVVDGVELPAGVGALPRY
ncbi:hypothetical protein [Prauserella alba]|uniref:Uncharacterized protein n=1 Tax=Prauserella alba TaxID=176898 RepID=A0ABN1VLC8_9PSEU|nr:hypothetical protein [Prauserella alba]MCP2180924.1 hypothetical protein [Prauserella alba]